MPKNIKGAKREALDGKKNQNRPVGRIQQFPKVDWDAEFKCQITPADFAAKVRIPLGAVEGSKDKAPQVRGFVATMERDKKSPTGLKVVINKVNSTEGMKEFLGSKEYKASMKEFDAFAFGGSMFGVNNSTAPFPPNNEYTPLIGGPWAKQLYLFDYLDMHAKCLAGDTRIPLLDGTSPTIKELSEREGSYWVYSNDNGKIVPGRAFNARKTDIREVLEIALDNEKTFRCTSDHPIMLRNGQFKDAGFLVPGESLMPLYRRATRGYERVYHPALDLWEQTHHMVMREANVDEFFSTRDMTNTMVIDHKDENHTDNRPENLQVITRKANIAKVSQTQGKRQRSGIQMKKLWEERREELSAKISKAQKVRWATQSPEKRAARIAKVIESNRITRLRKKAIVINHKVVSIKKLGYEEVYDLSVDKFHNFAIEQGIFVHNCFESKNHNPLAKEIVDLLTFFSFGKGVQIKFNNPKVQDVWQIFEKRNRFQEFLRMDSDTITWAGEIMTQKKMFPDGMPRLVHIDPSTVWEIITDPQDVELPYYYHQQFQTQWQLTYKAGDISSEYIVNDIPASEMIHKKINVVPGEKRGRSDLFAVLGWLKRFKDYYDARITKAQMEESFGLDVTINGSANDVDAWLNDAENSKIPRPGDKLVHNEAVIYKYITPTSSSSGNATDSVGEAIRSIVATGVGISPEYLGVGGKSGTRATAITKSEPASRKFEDRQTFLKNYIGDIIDWWKVVMPGLPAFQVREANLGKLKAALQKREWINVVKEATALLSGQVVKEPVDMDYQVIFPEIGTEDRSAKLKDIAQTQALQYISRERAANMSAAELMLDDYDYDEEQEKIRLELQERQADPLYNGDEDPAMNLLGKGALNQGAPGALGPDGKPASTAADGSQASDAAFAATSQQDQGN